MDRLTDNRVGLILRSSRFSAFLLALGLLFSIILRLHLQSFGLSVGYVHLLVITLAGLRFGWKGGLATAGIASLVLVSELTLFRTWPGRDIVVDGLHLRLLAYLLQGVVIGWMRGVRPGGEGAARV